MGGAGVRPADRSGNERNNSSVLEAYDNRQEKQVLQGLTAQGIRAYTKPKKGGYSLAHRKPQFSKSFKHSRLSTTALTGVVLFCFAHSNSPKEAAA
jgi:hypothetical protein